MKQIRNIHYDFDASSVMNKQRQASRVSPHLIELEAFERGSKTSQLSQHPLAMVHVGRLLTGTCFQNYEHTAEIRNTRKGKTVHIMGRVAPF